MATVKMPKCGVEGCGKPMEIAGVVLSCDDQHVHEVGYTDPLVQKITEAVNSEEAGTNFLCVIDTDHIIIAESEIKHETGCYDSSIILVMRAKAPCKDLPFVTWMCARADGRSLSSGHYDMSLSAACCDFVERCRAHGVNPGKMFGDYMFGPQPSKREKKACGSTR